MKLPSDPNEREILSKLYGVAIDEYRFEVRLNSDRTRDYFFVNLALITAAIGLFRLENGRAGMLLVMFLFVVGAATCLLTARALSKGHSYYRRAAFKVTLLEEQLGLLAGLVNHDHPDANLAIGTTLGMANKEKILRDPGSWLEAGLTRGSIVYYQAASLILLAVVNVAGVAAAGFRFVRATPPLWNKVSPWFSWFG